MSQVQEVMQALVSPARAKAIEAESRQWIMRCPCGAERSVWDAGGIRYKAAGNPRRLAKCPKCGKLTWHVVSRQIADDDDVYTPPPEVTDG